MRTRPIGTVAALIAVIALVATAGPAATRTPGPAREPAPAAFTPFVSTGLTAATTTSIHPPAAPAVLDVLVDGGVAPIPTRPPAPAAPPLEAAVAAKVVAVPWRTAAYSWYGPGLYGHGTACGQTLTRGLLGVAHRSLPCGTRVTLRNPDTGRVVTVRVVDRGPYVAGRLWDLTRATCAALGACYTGRIQWRLP